MGKKGTAAAGSTKTTTIAKEESSLAQESTETGLTGAFASEVSTLCNQLQVPHITVCSRGSGNISRFAFVVDIDIEQECITAIHIRGWLLTEVVVTILLNSLVSCKTLNSVHLWNVGLSSSTLVLISQLLSDHNIRELNLDGNSLSSALPVVNLLEQCKSLVRLSMKNCNISDSFIYELSSSLALNGNLLHLNLSCNFIGDIGCSALATSLRLNRTLLTLSLTGNLIGDSGATSLAEVLSRFPLNHCEIVQRRKFLSTQSRMEDGHSATILDLQVEKRVLSPRGRSPTSTTVLNKSISKGEKISGTKSKKGEQKKEEKMKKEDRSKKALESKKGKSIKDGKSVKKADQGPESPHPEPAQTVNPLGDPDLEMYMESTHGELYMPGNTILVYLALAYNQIGSTGMLSMLNALKVQKKYSALGPGLLRLILDHNFTITVLKGMCGTRLLGGDTNNIIKEIESLLTEKKEDDGIATDQKKETD